MEEWIRLNLQLPDITYLYYAKIDYDYGCIEYFGSEAAQIDRLKIVIPNIYTLYPNSYPPNAISKTHGVDQWIDYTPEDVEGIIIRLEDKEN
ncbi:MAG: hypothetical protein AAF696_16640 [Bacteroidota bacterium]